MGLKNWFRGKPSDQDIRDEIQAHLAMRSEHDQSDEAAARKRLGNQLRVQEDVRAVWLSTWLDQTLQDVRYGIRTIRANSGFTMLIVLTLGLVIGLNTAVFSIANAVLLRPLTYADPQRWVWISNYDAIFNAEMVAAPDYLDWRSQAQSFEDMTAYDYEDSALGVAGDASQVRLASVSPNFWGLSGARLALGAFPGPQDERAVLISSRLFNERFHGDPGVIGKTVTLDVRPFTIAGVLTAEFRFLLPAEGGGIETREVEAYRSLILDPATTRRDRGMRLIRVVGKLKPDASPAQARSELESIQGRVAPHGPQFGRLQLRVTPLKERLVGSFRRAIQTLSAAAALLLLIACANIIGLLLARTTARHREIAIRAAIDSAARDKLRARGVLVAAQLAFAMILLAAAGLMLKSFVRMNAYPPGFAPERTVLLSVELLGPPYADQVIQQRQEETLPRRAYVREALRRLQSMPGVEAAGVTNAFMREMAFVEGQPDPPPGQRGPSVFLNTASADYARAAGMRLLKGRWITDSETTPVIVINEAFGRRVFGDQDPLGKRIRRPGPHGDRFATVVGIVADLKLSKLDEAPGPTEFVPYMDSPFLGAFTVTVRTTGDPRSIEPAIRQAISELDPAQPVYGVRTLESALADSIAPRRLNLLLMGIFAGTAVLLAVIGIYGVIAYSVTQRTNEIGVRVALGAQRGQVISMVMRNGLMVAASGIAVGLAAALGLTRLMASLLYEVRPTDPATFTVITIALAAAALLACCIPALRATRIDPVIALRCE